MWHPLGAGGVSERPVEDAAELSELPCELDEPALILADVV